MRECLEVARPWPLLRTALVSAAAAVSALWFRIVLKRNGLRLRFAVR